MTAPPKGVDVEALTVARRAAAAKRRDALTALAETGDWGALLAVAAAEPAVARLTVLRALRATPGVVSPEDTMRSAGIRPGTQRPCRLSRLLSPTGGHRRDALLEQLGTPPPPPCSPFFPYWPPAAGDSGAAAA